MTRRLDDPVDEAIRAAFPTTAEVAADVLNANAARVLMKHHGDAPAGSLLRAMGLDVPFGTDDDEPEEP